MSVALALSACTGSNVFSTSPGNSGGYSHYKGHGRYGSADNAASQDYFNNIPEGDNLWSSIRDNFQIDHNASNPAVQAQLNWFMHNQAYLDRTARRAAPYMYYIYQQVKTRHLPSELVLLPIIESAYNPFVSSAAGAAGLWQLEPGTARTFGVHADFWYDGRRDINASTKAALDYFSYLQNLFGGNWLLAIAAYNTGEGNVAAAVRHNARLGLNTDFWSLPLAAETRSYVPRLLALAIIISDPARYHIQLPPISNSPYLGEVDVSSQLTLEKAAQLAGVSLGELKTLNPGYRRNTLDPNQPYRILLPIDRVNFFRENLLRQNSGQNGLWGRYKVQDGDTWNKIAKQFSTPASLLQQINKADPNTPPAGQILLIPENAHNESAIAAAATAASPNPTSSSQIAAPDLSDAADLDKSAMQSYERQNEAPAQSSHETKITHVVRRGETLSHIAAKYKVTTAELAHWNHLSTHSAVYAGRKLTIWRRPVHSHYTHHTTHYSPHKIIHTKTKPHKIKHTTAHVKHKTETRHH
ncbi:MAG: LysM peptidoglycan-binding domain-containing protein [Gammaproteobacteria bacterium]|nr:LysM peptidoglycan-binding domain-containing protein [Gammaproteobacteria bacterium]